jgi:secretion/DNA translocation related TadE-like protein
VSDESGSASIYVLAAMAALTVVALPVGLVSVGLAAHRDAVRAADLSALGGANTSLDDVVVACATAARVAHANGAVLHRCSLSRGVLSVEVGVTTSLPLLPRITATARAGLRR